MNSSLHAAVYTQKRNSGSYTNPNLCHLRRAGVGKLRRHTMLRIMFWKNLDRGRNDKERIDMIATR